MAFNVLDNKNKTELEQRNMATISGIYGNQFGREVFASVIKFKDLADFIQIFPEVQRDLMPRKVASIRRYIISGLENPEELRLRFFSALTVTCKGHMFYDGVNNRLAIDVNNSKLSINDGQHRLEAIKTALELLETKFAKSKDKERTGKLSRMIEELAEMVIPVTIFNGLDESEEKQLFHDLNNLAQRPSRNANIKLSQTDLVSIMARNIAVENRYLVHYGVEKDRMSIHKNNPNTFLLTTIHASIKELFAYEQKKDKDYLNDNSYNHYSKKANETFNNIFYALPADLEVKGKYLLEKSYALRAICKFIADARQMEDASEENIFKALKEVDWKQDLDSWKDYEAFISEKGSFMFSGTGTYDGYKAVYGRLMSNLENKEKGEM